MQNLRAPLNNLLKVCKMGLDKGLCKSFQKKVFKKLISDLFLAHFDPKQETVVAYDASDYGIGAVILHRFEDGTTNPVAHASRTLLQTEKN